MRRILVLLFVALIAQQQAFAAPKRRKSAAAATATPTPTATIAAAAAPVPLVGSEGTEYIFQGTQTGNVQNTKASNFATNQLLVNGIPIAGGAGGSGTVTSVGLQLAAGIT